MLLTRLKMRSKVKTKQIMNLKLCLKPALRLMERMKEKLDLKKLVDGGRKDLHG